MKLEVIVLPFQKKQGFELNKSVKVDVKKPVPMRLKFECGRTEEGVMENFRKGDEGIMCDLIFEGEGLDEQRFFQEKSGNIFYNGKEVMMKRLIGGKEDEKNKSEEKQKE